MSIASGCRNKIKVLIMLTVVTSIFAGCASFTPYRAYTGQELSPGQVANVRIEKRYNYADTKGNTGDDPMAIKAVDGQVIENIPSEVYLLPGRHELLVKVIASPLIIAIGEKLSGQKWERLLSLDCEAGKTYTIRHGFYKNTRGMKGALRTWWIEDEATGAVVSGERPPNL